jgi:hypothetical protein
LGGVSPVRKVHELEREGEVFFILGGWCDVGLVAGFGAVQ